MSQELNAARAELADATLEYNKFRDADISSDAALKLMVDALERMNAAERAYNEIVAVTPEPQSPLRKRVAYNSDEAIQLIANQQWLIDQVMPVDGFGVLYGPSGSYKSFVAVDMSACIAAAMAWHGRDVDEPGHVLYIGAEGAAGLHLRKKAWEIRYQKPLTNLGILSSAVTINSEECNALVGLCQELVEEIQEPIRLIVIDTLARSFEGEENSATDMGEFVKACDYIREMTGATILVIHHSGKDADKGARGSSALRAACDFEFKVVSTGKKMTKISCTKAKDSDPFEDIAFKLNVVEIGVKNKKGVPLSSLVLSATESGDDMRPDLTGHKQTINSLVASEMARTGEDWVFKAMVQDAFFALLGVDKKHGATKTAWSRGINDLVVDGWLEIDGNGRITRPNPY